MLVVSAAQAQEKWDLRRCVTYAVANNISVKQQDIQARIADLTYRQNRDQRIPSLSFNLNDGQQYGRSIDPVTNLFTNQSVGFVSTGLQSNVTLFNWFNIKNTTEANRLNAEAARKQTEKIKDDISLNVANAYLTALLAYEQKQLAGITVSQTKEQLNNTRKRVNAGALPELNAAELDAQLARDSATFLNAENTRQLNLLQLKAILNLDAAAPFDIATPPVNMIPVEPFSEMQPADVFREALATQPLQIVNNLKLQAAIKSAQASRGAMFPTLTANGGLQSSYSSANKTITGKVPLFKQFNNNFRQSIGLGLSVPIFNAHSLRTNWLRAKENIEVASLQIQADTNLLKQNIYQAYQNALNAFNTFNARKRAVESSEYAFTLGKKRYDIGLLPTFELLTLSTNADRAKLDMVSAQYDYVFRMKVLEFYKGKGIKL